MKTAGILFFAVFLIGSTLFSSFALDLGGVLDNSSTISISESTVFTQSDKLSLWFDSELGQYLNFYILGSYTFTTDEPYHLLDLDSLRLDGKFTWIEEGPAFFGFSLGRLTFSEFSQNILSHSADGFILEFKYPALDLTTSFGFTGLLFKHASTLRISKADASDSTDDSIFFGPPRLIGVVDITFPELFLRQSLTISLLFQEDLKSEADLIDVGEESYQPLLGGRVDTQYMGLGLSGPIVSALHYDALFYLGTGRTLSYVDGVYGYNAILSVLTGGGLKLFIPEALFSRLNLKFLLATGDIDSVSFVEGNTRDYFTNFVPISRPSLALVFSPQLGNIFLFDLNYSIKPFALSRIGVLENFQTLIKSVFFFRSSNGPISESGIDPGSTSPFLGAEIDGSINYRPFSDLGMSLLIGCFIPNNGSGGAFLQSLRTTEFVGSFELSLSF